MDNKKDFIKKLSNKQENLYCWETTDVTNLADTVGKQKTTKNK